KISCCDHVEVRPAIAVVVGGTDPGPRLLQYARDALVPLQMNELDARLFRDVFEHRRRGSDAIGCCKPQGNQSASSNRTQLHKECRHCSTLQQNPTQPWTAIGGLVAV